MVTREVTIFMKTTAAAAAIATSTIGVVAVKLSGTAAVQSDLKHAARCHCDEICPHRAARDAHLFSLNRNHMRHGSIATIAGDATRSHKGCSERPKSFSI